jgi:NAD(P)H-dependent FMN reductase
MDILTILGSPRRHGNTARVLGRFEELAGSAHRVDRVNITDHVVHGCRGCNACQSCAEEPGCGQDDDAVSILVRMIAADVVVYATPLYSWDYSAQLKALVDRHYCLVKWGDDPDPTSLIEGKRVALLVTCAGPVEGNADVIQVIFDRGMAYSHCRVAGKYIVPNCTTPEALGDRAEETARRMLADLTAG